MLPVGLTSSPSSTAEWSPRMTAPIECSSRLRAMPYRRSPSWPTPKSSSSFAMTPGRPETRAMPSPLSITCPTCSRVGRYSYSSILDRSTLVMSSREMRNSVMGVLFLLASRRRRWLGDAETGSQVGESPGHAAVDHGIPDTDDHTTEDRRIDDYLQRDVLAGRGLDGGAQPVGLVVVERHGGARLSDGASPGFGGQADNRVGDLAEQARTPALDDE